MLVGLGKAKKLLKTVKKSDIEQVSLILHNLFLLRFDDHYKLAEYFFNTWQIFNLSLYVIVNKRRRFFFN